jgi:hypothetical protein
MQTGSNIAPSDSNQGTFPATKTEESVVGTVQNNVGQTGYNATVLGGSFDELKDAGDPKQPEIQQPAPSSVPGINQPEVPRPEIEPQTHEPEIQEPLGDSDGSGHSEETNLTGQTGYNELNKDAPVQNPTRTEEPSVTEETEDFPR